MGDKTKLSPSNEQYATLESQSKKVNFLIETIMLLKADSPLPAHLEMGFTEYGLNELFEEIQQATKDAIIPILEARLEEEKKALITIINFIK